MLSEMVRETIHEVGNAHLLAKGPWALGGRDHFWANPDADAGRTRSESRGEGQVNRTMAGCMWAST